MKKSLLILMLLAAAMQQLVFATAITVYNKTYDVQNVSVYTPGSPSPFSSARLDVGEKEEFSSMGKISQIVWGNRQQKYVKKISTPVTTRGMFELLQDGNFLINFNENGILNTKVIGKGEPYRGK